MRGLQATVLVLFTLIVGTDMGKPLSGQAPARDGFFIGFGVGGGSLAFEDESDREGSGVGHFKIGGALSDHVLLGAEVGGWTKEMGEGVTITSSYLNAVAYLYPAPTGGFFLKGGLGFASSGGEWSLFDGASFSAAQDGLGFTLGAGYDIGFGGRFGLTPYADFHQGFFEDGSTRLVSLGLSFNWY
jgi:hypothetical protein